MDIVKINKTTLNDWLWVYKGKMEHVDNWAFMGTPYPTLIILVLYLAFVTKLGPHYMKNIAPYNLNNVLVAYNAAQVIVSGMLLCMIGQTLWQHGIWHKKCMAKISEYEQYKFNCLSYYYMLAKTTELLDTIFFVLRKKQNQVTFLHVYHHGGMFGVMWLVTKYGPNENLLFMAFLNCGVHVLMYTYYALSAFPSLKKVLWWKKYITRIQLIQFVTAFFHLIAIKFISDCPPPTGQYYFGVLNIALFYYLFNNFYKNNYTKLKILSYNKKLKSQHIDN